MLSNAQNKISISGYVTDSLSGEALIGATVYINELSKVCSTNEFGYYSLTFYNKDSISIVASYTGYQKKTTRTQNGNNVFNFRLSPGLKIDEVVVQSKSSGVVSKENINTVQLQMKQVKKLPSLFGENDLVQAMQLMPGVQSGGEGQSRLLVRGGSPDQNLVLLDDVPLYYISHLSGLFSIFNTDAINYVDMTKGGFPARYGGRLSSVVDVRMKDGNMFKHEGNCSIGLLSSRISYQGPVKKERSSYIISARTSVLPVMKLISEGLVKNHFYDINGKFNIKLGESDRLYMSFYGGNDLVSTKQFDPHNNEDERYRNKTKWGNKLAALRWNHLFSHKLFSNLVFSVIDYRYNEKILQNFDKNQIKYTENKSMYSGITDICAKYHLKWFLSPHISFRGGLQSTTHLFEPNNEYIKTTSSAGWESDSAYSSQINAFENALYIENDLNYNKWSGNIGARIVSYAVNSKMFCYAEPRISLNYQPLSQLQLNVSYARMNQFVHLLSYSNAGFPNDYWMPATDIAKPEYSNQFTIGGSYNFFNNKYSISVIGYKKQLNNLVAFKDGASLYGNFKRWENVVELNGKGNSKGLELQFQKLKGKTTGWLSATLAKTTRQFNNINRGEVFPFEYDRRLDISLVINHPINERVELSMVWNYGSAYPVTLAAGKYQFDNDREMVVWADRNNSRLKDFHRLDVALNFPYNIGKFDGTFSLSVLNIYNRKNAFYYYYEDYTGFGTSGPSGDLGLKLYQQPLIPFLPSFSYSFKF